MNIKYLEYLKLYGDEIFHTDTNEITFDIISAISLSNKYFYIIRKAAINYMPNFIGSVKETINLSKFATYRRIELSDDKTSIDFESFELEVGNGESYEFVYDYSFVFDKDLNDIQTGDYSINGKKYHIWLYPLSDSIVAKNRMEYLNAEYKSNNVYALYQCTIDNNVHDDIPMYKLNKEG